MSISTALPLGRTTLGRIVLRAAMLAAFAAAPGHALAEDPPLLPAQSEEASLADTEKAFWACDYIATTEGLQATPIAACRLATETLKVRKFAGSFEKLLAWWRTNKDAEHLKIHLTRKADAIV